VGKGLAHNAFLRNAFDARYANMYTLEKESPSAQKFYMLAVRNVVAEIEILNMHH
jgi:hypothetical protein